MRAMSILIPYRDRPQHLAALVAWWPALVERGLPAPIEVLIVEMSGAPTARAACEAAGISYVHVESEGVFHKTRALNEGLRRTRSDLVMAYDVDLVPLGRTLERHWTLADRHRELLVTGYRLMSEESSVSPGGLESAAARARVAPEDAEFSLRRYLLHGERFGIAPVFERSRLEAIGGWDEQYVGWGAEDQDVISRYLGSARALLRAQELCYLHLHHEHAPGWNDLERVVANRRRYYEKLRSDSHGQR